MPIRGSTESTENSSAIVAGGEVTSVPPAVEEVERASSNAAADGEEEAVPAAGEVIPEEDLSAAAAEVPVLAEAAVETGASGVPAAGHSADPGAREAAVMRASGGDLRVREEPSPVQAAAEAAAPSADRGEAEAK
jgi:hypothetical protein